MEMQTLYDYLRIYARELGRRIVETYPPLHALNDPPAPELSRLLRKPLPARPAVALLPFSQQSETCHGNANPI